MITRSASESQQLPADEIEKESSAGSSPARSALSAHQDGPDLTGLRRLAAKTNFQYHPLFICEYERVVKLAQEGSHFEAMEEATDIRIAYEAALCDACEEAPPPASVAKKTVQNVINHKLHDLLSQLVISEQPPPPTPQRAEVQCHSDKRSKYRMEARRWSGDLLTLPAFLSRHEEIKLNNHLSAAEARDVLRQCLPDKVLAEIPASRSENYHLNVLHESLEAGRYEEAFCDFIRSGGRFPENRPDLVRQFVEKVLEISDEATTHGLPDPFKGNLVLRDILRHLPLSRVSEFELGCIRQSAAVRPRDPESKDRVPRLEPSPEQLRNYMELELIPLLKRLQRAVQQEQPNRENQPGSGSGAESLKKKKQYQHPKASKGQVFATNLQVNDEIKKNEIFEKKKGST